LRTVDDRSPQARDLRFTSRVVSWFPAALFSPEVDDDDCAVDGFQRPTMSWLDRLLGRPDARDLALADAHKRASETIDPIFAKVRGGDVATDVELDACGAAVVALWNALAARFGTQENAKLPERERADYYLTVLKLAAMEHPGHNAWPLRSDLRALALQEIRRRLAAAPDPWLGVGAIPGVLAWGDAAAAVEIFDHVANDTFLSRLVTSWADAMRIDYPSKHDAAAIGRFLEAVRPVAPWNEPASSVPHDRRWLLHTSFFPSIALDSRTTLAEMRPASAVRAGLAQGWRVKDAPSARSVLAWLRDEGHSAQLQDDLAAPGAPSKPERGAYIEANRAALERYRIRAWDLGRMVQVARGARKAGYLDETEVWSWIEEAGVEIVATYDSWDAYAADYAMGSGYFDPTNPNDNHRAMAMWMMTDPTSPYRRLAFGGSAGPRVPG